MTHRGFMVRDEEVLLPMLPLTYCLLSPYDKKPIPMADYDAYDLVNSVMATVTEKAARISLVMIMNLSRESKFLHPLHSGLMVVVVQIIEIAARTYTSSIIPIRSTTRELPFKEASNKWKIASVQSQRHLPTF